MVVGGRRWHPESTTPSHLSKSGADAATSSNYMDVLALIES